MKTELIKAGKKINSNLEITKATNLLRSGEVVVFPTETVYGLGANAFNESAVAKIFEAKNRPADNPTIVHISSIEQLHSVVSKVPKKAIKLIKAFWPGPLTLVLPKSIDIPNNVTAGLSSVAVRMPSHPVALALIKECNFPIAAPSANTSTKPSPTSAKHAYDDLNGKIPLVIDAGSCEHGLESTVISLLEEKPILLRPGAITIEQIEKVIGKISVASKNSNSKETKKPLSPGMKYKHYSPKAEVILVIPKRGASFVQKVFESDIDKLNIGVISFSKKIGVEKEYYFKKSLPLYAKELFASFRALDNEGVDAIFVEGIEEKGLGLAIMNRLRKAASKII
jgi:L-threonylcarbamoyladenylate synthase